MINDTVSSHVVSGDENRLFPGAVEVNSPQLFVPAHGPDLTPSVGSRNPQTILFAEDNDDPREVTEYFLRTVGYSVIACADAMIASRAFRARDGIDILLTDYEMPVRSGLELARELTELRPSLPVLIISGSLFTDEMLGEIRSRNWTFVSKPCRLPALQDELQSMLACDSHSQRESAGAERRVGIDDRLL